MAAETQWYAARLLMESRRAGQPEPHLYEDRIILVRAADEREAWRRAADLARATETAYDTAGGERIEDRLREVLLVVPLIDQDLGDGAEVYHTFIDARQLRHLLRSLEGGPFP